jgi:hypothetical protein
MRQLHTRDTDTLRALARPVAPPQAAAALSMGVIEESAMKSRCVIIYQTPT